MPIYWSVAAIPELADLPSAERRRVWRRGATRALLSPLPLLVVSLCSLATARFTVAWMERWQQPAAALLGALVFSLLWGFAFAQWLAERARPHLREIAGDATRAGPPLRVTTRD